MAKCQMCRCVESQEPRDLGLGVGGHPLRFVLKTCPGKREGKMQKRPPFYRLPALFKDSAALFKGGTALFKGGTAELRKKGPCNPI